MKPIFTYPVGKKVRGLLFFFMLLLSSSATIAQLGVYDFTGVGACPNQNPSVAVQPGHSTFSNFTSTAGNCVTTTNAFSYNNLNNSNVINPGEYFTFTITPSAGYSLNLTSLSFSNFAEQNQSGNHWNLRSSLDNYASDLGTAPISSAVQTPVVNLPAGSFGNVGAVTFRLYVVKMQSGGAWTVDDVTLNGSEINIPADPGNPTSNSPQCVNPGVTITANGTPPVGISWYWETSAAGTSTANNASISQTVTTSGTYYIRAQDDATLIWSTGAGSVAIAITPGVGVPVFTTGATSIRCQGGSSVTYTANASNSTGITYDLDAISISNGNTINSATGVVTYAPTWNGISVITATATGCGTPTTAAHTVTITNAVGATSFTLGASTTRCQGAGTVTYTANAANNSGIVYTLDAANTTFGNSIVAGTGKVTYLAGWTGTSTITATSSGCNGPTTATHTVTTVPTVGTPAFTAGAGSTRCQGSGMVNYGASSTNTTGITYTLDAASTTGGNSINPATGDVTYVAGWSGPSTITASAAGCNGPKTATHTVTTTSTVGTPVFTLGATSSRCLGANTVTYGATASNNTGITYSLDATSTGFGNGINPATGAVTYLAGWVGPSIITATANGCNGPGTATHTATTNSAVAAPVFTAGTSSVRCQGGGSNTYPATAANSTGITYSLDLLSSVLNSINAATGQVNWSILWNGTSIITATATGCNGPKTATHTVTVTATVGTPVFDLGASSTRCQGANTVNYNATSSNNSGITYTLDASSIAAGNSIDPVTGNVTYTAAWVGPSSITATATGCNGPKTATHTATTNTTVGATTFTLGASSTRCQGAGNVTYTASASSATGMTYTLDAVSAAAGNTIVATTGKVNYTAAWVGTSIITATAAGCNGPTSATHTVTITATVGAPTFTLGTTSIRCQGAGTLNYAATASTTTGITYLLDAASSTAGNTINPATGDVTYLATWSGTTTITASAAGCGGPKNANHVVTVTPTVGTPTFTLGATSTRCLGGGTVTYTAPASNNTGITYTLDATSSGFGNTINAATGAVIYLAGWVGNSTITATATGCNGPSTASHTATTTAAVINPVFAMGSTSTRCQGAGTVTYTASATYTTGITYTLDAISLAAGNTIVAATGAVNYTNAWSGTSTITANAAGCAGPKAGTHVVTITPTVGTPIFTLGPTSARCQGAVTVTYGATSTNNTGITYSLDAASVTGGNSINPATGGVTYVAGWTGTSTITATATGCNGPKTANHTVTINITVGPTIFTLGATSTRCQGAGSVSYTANATNKTGISYTLDATTAAAGNSINAATGVVTYVATWIGNATITATSIGCNGPTSSTHIATTTATVGTPSFTLGSNTTRCQGAATVIYTANASTTTGITYTLDATSTAAGNSIDATAGAVTYTAAWSGTSTITASAAGCSGPKTATHVVTTTATVGTPAFAMGSASVRTQGAGTVTYSATATTTTGITYGLNAAALAAGNTINAATGAVTYTAAWSGATTITASAAGCNGPVISTHVVSINTVIATSQLYLSDPGQILDRTDPVATGSTTTVQSTTLSSTGTTNTSFTQSPGMCSDLIIKAQTITISAYVSIISGSMPANPSITALLKYGAAGNTIVNLGNPTYNSGTNLLTWTGVPASDITVPAGDAITLVVTAAQANVTFKLDYHSQTKPSKISLPVSSFIDITSFNVYSAAYPGGAIRISSTGNTTEYARAVVTDPFGAADINGTTINITPPATVVTAIPVATSGCTKTYEYDWTTPAVSGNYTLTATAKQGYENTVTNTTNFTINICSVCPPVALSDSATGSGGAPLIVDVLANDYDPNNNLNAASLSIVTQSNNGTGFLSNGKIVYLPNGSFAGRDTITYQVCDNTSPTPLCATAQVFFTINPSLIDPCGDATKSHTYFLPYSETEARMALDSSTTTALASNNIRTVISLKIPYPGMIVVWDHWEDGYEANPLNPTQTTTQVWGDGNPYNGIAPGYANDIIPAGGSIVLDNTIPTNPRVNSVFFFDGRDKIYSSGQIAVTQVCGEPSNIGLQCMKTNVSSTAEYGTNFTIPVGQNFNSQDFRYTALFIRAQEDNTVINIDKDNNGTFETIATINQGQVYLVNGGVKSGASISASAPVGVDLHFGGQDNYSSREVPIYPASWYYNTYYSPVPTTGRNTNPADSAVVMLYNNLNRPISINWSSGIPSSGTINLPAKTVVRFPLAKTQTGAYKFVNPTGESFTAIEIVDSYTPGGGGNTGSDFDWAFNLIAENRLTDYATIAWAPGSTDGTRDDNPVWVTPTANTTIYVKYDGNVTTGTLVSPCGLHYDVSYTLNALNHKRLLDLTDNDQSGLAVYTCDGVKLAAVYGEDPSTAVIANPSWDVGSTIQPFCKEKLIFANDDYARTMVNQPVTIPILLNDYGFLAVVDPTSVTNTGLLLAKHGVITINLNGTVLYTPNPGYVGNDTFEYNVCSTPSPIVCDVATVYVQISVCPSPLNENIISGQLFVDKNKDGINNDGGQGFGGAKVYLYVDGNCNATIDANELRDSVTVDASGTYQFTTYPEKFVSDDFDGPGGTNTCAGGSDGTAGWASNWVDAGDPSTNFCNNSQTVANTDAEIVKDGAFGYALRLKDNNVSATRTVNLASVNYAFLTFSYRRKSASLTAGHNVTVQASADGSTFGTVFTIAGDGNTDASYVTVYNQDISAYASATTYIRFITNNNMADADTVYIDNVKVQFLKYPQCYITKVNSATLPATYHFTTSTQNSFTATSGITCLAPFDFGIAKNDIGISGTLFNDANGLTDNLINGTGINTASGTTMYAYLVDTSGKIAFRSNIAANGSFNFPTADVLSSYELKLSTNNMPIFSTAPSNASLPGGWALTGDSYGTNNLAGAGICPWVPSCYSDVNTGAVASVSNVNFGIERLPDSDPRNISYQLNTPGVQYDITGGLTGTDPEDGILGSGKTYKITTLPTNAKLYYNGIAVIVNQVIVGFNASLLKIDPDDATVVSIFTYASKDAAGLYDPTPATVTVTWGSLLPITILDFNGKLNGSKVDLFWNTSSESNSDRFDVERSTDAINFSPIGTVKAKGFSSVTSNYVSADPMPVKGMNYYRLKMIDRDGSYVYSKTIGIQVNKTEEMTVKIMPNPFTSKLDIYINLPRNTDVTIDFVDMNGIAVLTKKVKGYKGYNWFSFSDLDKVPSAAYMLKLSTDDGIVTQKLIKAKNQ